MSNSSRQPWSHNPYAPNIPRREYLPEKENFIGNLLGSMLYGFVIVLFFKCIGALLYPTGPPRKGVKWGLVAHTMAMFSFVTINTAMSLYVFPVSYINYRHFSGHRGLPTGPFGYQLYIYPKPISTIPTLMFFLNNWLADGLLLYRCHVIYAMKYWVIAFPCLMYVASLAMGIMLVYQSSKPDSNILNHIGIYDFGVPSYSISLSLNVILTLMIIARLVVHNRKLRSSMGNRATTSGLYNSIITMFIESSALYAVSFLLFIGPWGSGNPAANVFSPILAETQVIAPFLIILRVANRTALTSDAVSGHVGSLRFKSQGRSVSGSETISGGDLVVSSEEVPCELGDEAVDTIEEVSSSKT